MGKMRWDDAANAKLFAAIMTVYEIQPQGAKVEQIAKLVGPDCTAEAVKHQLRKFRANKTKAGDTATPTASARKPAVSANKSTTKKATPAKGKKRAAGRQKEEDSDAGDDDDEEAMPETPTQKSKMGRSVSRSVTKRVYTYDDDDDQDEEHGEPKLKNIKSGRVEEEDETGEAEFEKDDGEDDLDAEGGAEVGAFEEAIHDPDEDVY